MNRMILISTLFNCRSSGYYKNMNLPPGSSYKSCHKDDYWMKIQPPAHLSHLIYHTIPKKA